MVNVEFHRQSYEEAGRGRQRQAENVLLYTKLVLCTKLVSIKSEQLTRTFEVLVYSHTDLIWIIVVQCS